LLTLKVSKILPITANIP